MLSIGLVGGMGWESSLEYYKLLNLGVERLASHDLEIVLPPTDQHDVIDQIIYGELVHGKVLDTSRTTVVGVIEDLWDGGAQGVILGCTELELLVRQADSELPVFPCTTLHVEAALDRALDSGGTSP